MNQGKHNGIHIGSARKNIALAQGVGLFACLQLGFDAKILGKNGGLQVLAILTGVSIALELGSLLIEQLNRKLKASIDDLQIFPQLDFGNQLI